MKDQPVPLPSIFGVLESTEFENTSMYITTENSCVKSKKWSTFFCTESNLPHAYSKGSKLGVWKLFSEFVEIGSCGSYQYTNHLELSKTSPLNHK